MKWIFSFLVLANISQALAWGPEGHMIVAEIADQRLTPKARAGIKALLPDETLAEVANWADVIKGKPEWTKTKPWHFINIPDGMTYETAPRAADGDCIVAINQMIKTLTSKSSSSDKTNALKFLVHFMGDIHQPLHAGRTDDLGGNTIKLQFEGMNTNLHQLWDSGMITQQKMDFPQYAQFLLSHASNSGAPAITVPFVQIVSEDMAVRSMIYDFSAQAFLDDASIKLDDVYMKRNLSTLNKQLLSGGLRLANLLNALFI